MTEKKIDIIICGAPKAGSTSLFNYLIQHPDICGSNKKETRFFKEPNAIDNIDSYFNDFFGHSKTGQFLIEATPSYLYNVNAKSQITSLSNKPLLIFILKKPSEAILSYFNFQKYSTGFIDQSLSFQDFLESKKGKQIKGYFRYGHHLNDWLERVNNNDVLIFILDEFIKSPTTHLQRVSESLNISENPWTNLSLPTHNKTINKQTLFYSLNSKLKLSLLIPEKFKQKLKSLYNYFFTKKELFYNDSYDLSLEQLDKEFVGDQELLQELMGREKSIW